MRLPKPSLRYLFLCPVFVIFGACSEGPPADGRGDPIAELAMDREAGRITLLAREASLFEIIRRLEAEQGVRIVVPDLTNDRRVTVTLDGVPLQEGLRALIPDDIDFRFEPKELEVAIPGNTGTKQAPEKPGADEPPLPKKGDPLPPDQGRPKIAKGEPGDPSAAIRFTDGEEGTKVTPTRSRERVGSGAKVAIDRPPEKEQYLRLNLFMDSNNNVRLKQIHVIAGRLISPPFYNGRFIYAAYVGADLVAVGSMQDPLLVRSLGVRPGRLTTRDESGYFSISLPAQFLAKERLAKARVRFFLLDKDPVGLDRLTRESFPAVARSLDAIAEIGSDELVEHLSQAIDR
jgi:hypothetical protein